MANKPIKINRNTSPQKRLRSAKKSNGVMGLYPSMRGFELFWIPLIVTGLLVLYLVFLGFVVAPFVPLSPDEDTRMGQVWMMVGIAVLLLIADIVAFVFFWKCPFCGCSLSFDRYISFGGSGVCRVCRKKIWGRFKGRKM